MDDAARARLSTGALHLGVTLAPAQVEQLSRYVTLLLTWNEKVNLTAVVEPLAIVDKHLLDSLALVPFLGDAKTLLDVGTGPGLPSVVLAIARPELAITAVDSIQKKVHFVRAVSRELGLSVVAECARIERLAEAPGFEIAVSRATFEPSEWVERGARFVRPGGGLLAMLSAQQLAPPAPPDFVEGPSAEHVIGGAVRRVLCFRRNP